MRFYDIDSGAIAIVLQDTVLFSDSIKNNLKYSNESATESEIEEAARISHCHQMIMNLPEGYDTHLTQFEGNVT